jgi:FkbM family methyltransferase
MRFIPAALSLGRSRPARQSSYVELPRDHYVHLKELAAARREDLPAAARFLLSLGVSNPENTLTGRYKGNACDRHRFALPPGTHIDPALLMRAIQALPRWIKSKTDFPMSEDYSFSASADTALSITIRGRTFFDRTPVGAREKEMYAFLRDRFPKPMTLEEFQVLSLCQSQYAILLDEPDAYVMPGPGQICVDAGSFVGYKAMAMADIVGREGRILAIELDEDNFNLQQRCFAVNNVETYVTGICAALSDTEAPHELMTSVKGTMQHSLTRFDGFRVRNSRQVQTKRLETVLTEAQIPYVDVLHVSVNGHEAHVLNGLGSYAGKVGTFCVMVPYSINGVDTEELVLEFFRANDIKVWGRSQAAIIAGPQAGRYPVRPIARG